jgi:hypothetical protein
MRLKQLAICDICQARTAFLCWVRLRLHLCRRCVGVLDLLTEEVLAPEEDESRAA